MCHSNLDSDKWYGNDGYFSAIILASFFFFFVQINRRTKYNEAEVTTGTNSALPASPDRTSRDAPPV
jgi:hypothetical protein